MIQATRNKLIEAADSLSVARGALEDAKPPGGTALAGCVKEARDELDYVQEAVAAAVAAEPTIGGGGEQAVWRWLSDLEHSGRWDMLRRIEERAERAAKEWEQRRMESSLYHSDAVVRFIVPMPLNAHAPSLYCPPDYPPSQSEAACQILIPAACRDREQARYVARRQLEEAAGL